MRDNLERRRSSLAGLRHSLRSIVNITLWTLSSFSVWGATIAFTLVLTGFNTALTNCPLSSQSSPKLHHNEQEKEDKCSALENAERTLQSLVDTESVRIDDLERQARELRDKLKEAENARKLLETRLEQALRDQKKSKRELADRATQEQVGCGAPRRVTFFKVDERGQAWGKVFLSLQCSLTVPLHFVWLSFVTADSGAAGW